MASVPPKTILVRGVNWLGDAVMSTPALQRLREAHPAAQITLLTHEKLAELWQNHPALDKVMTFSPHESLLQIARRLRTEHFEIALILPNSPRSALETFLGGIPERIGYRRAWRNLFLTRAIPTRPELVTMHKRSVREIKQLINSPRNSEAIPAQSHHLYHYLHLAAALGAKPDPIPPHIAVTAGEVTAIQDRFGFPRNAPMRPLLFGLNAGAEYGSAKRWPRDRFIAAAIAMQRQAKCHWWIFGGKSDQPLATEITSGIQSGGLPAGASVQSLAGQTTLRELCAALKACDVVLTNDTGPMHLTAAVGTPVIGLFGSTSPELTAPGLPGDTQHVLLKSDAACAPCFLRTCPIDFRCMNGLTVDQVVGALMEVSGRSH